MPLSNRPGSIIAVGLNPLLAPDAPTIGTATAGDASASVAFTAPANVGGSAITSYAVQSTPDGIGATGASSPITVTGLTNGTPYTFRATALNSYGPSPASAASNSVTPAIIQGQQAYTTAGTYSWVAPAGVTSVSVVAVGSGGGAVGGALGWKNNIPVVPGNSYTVVVGASVTGTSNGNPSYFINSSTVQGGGGIYAQSPTSSYVGDGGGLGGFGFNFQSGGGAGGYTGNGGDGGSGGSPSQNGSGGGGGGGWGNFFDPTTFNTYAGGGGGVGLLGQGANGIGGATHQGGGGGSGGTGGQGAFSGGRGGAYGGGSGNSEGYKNSGGGAVRIIWPGNTRLFPSTNTGNV
jgi:hypothetical protein